jgi:hypothetical protein
LKKSKNEPYFAEIVTLSAVFAVVAFVASNRFGGSSG